MTDSTGWSDDAWNRFQRHVVELDALAEGAGKLMDTFDDNRSPDSPANIEALTIPEMRHADNAQSYVFGFLDSQADLLFGLHRCLSQPLLRVSPWALARNTLELTSLVAWLLAADIGAPERARRVLNLRLKDIHEELLFAETVRQADPEGAVSNEQVLNLQIRTERVLREGAALRLAPNARSRPPFVGSSGVPPQFELARDLLGAAEWYRLMSSVGHGRGWATRGVATRRIGDVGRGFGRVRVHFSPESGQALLLYPINWFARSVWQFFWFMGWPRTGLANMLNETWDNLTLPGTRFWQDERTDAGSGPINDWRIRALGA